MTGKKIVTEQDLGSGFDFSNLETEKLNPKKLEIPVHAKDLPSNGQIPYKANMVYSYNGSHKPSISLFPGAPYPGYELIFRQSAQLPTDLEVANTTLPQVIRLRHTQNRGFRAIWDGLVWQVEFQSFAEKIQGITPTSVAMSYAGEDGPMVIRDGNTVRFQGAIEGSFTIGQVLFTVEKPFRFPDVFRGIFTTLGKTTSGVVKPVQIEVAQTGQVFHSSPNESYTWLSLSGISYSLCDKFSW